MAIFIPSILIGQKVGVVLSGGGASGLAHVGVLKALEENEIPIDCIAGTSMGAIVGSMYAAGMNLDQIEAFFQSEEFNKGIKGGVLDQYSYYFKQKEEDASWVTIKLDKDSLLNYGLPTKILDPVMMDLSMLKNFGPASAASNYDFDSLFVPFRCIGADIVKKKEHIFRSGELNEAVRVSSSYPFYFRPIRVNGKLLFDGGLYNNFPADVLYEDFIPDIIIGSNVSSNSPEPDENDLFSLLENMIVSKTDFTLPCEDGLVILPPVSSGTFEFDKAKENIDIGYLSTLEKMYQIKGMVTRRVDSLEISQKRTAFRNKFSPIRIRNIFLEGIGDKMRTYVENILFPKKDHSIRHLNSFIPAYYRLIEDDKIQYIYPKLRYDSEAEVYDLTLLVHQEKDLEISFGGNFSSRPVNTGFLQVKYNLFGKSPKSIIANSYFGKYYGSVLMKYKMDFPSRVPFNFELIGGLNRLDYFESFATFFEDVKPSFIIQNEKYAGVNFNFPESNKGKITIDGRYADLKDEYYQSDNFSSLDTADVTDLNAFSGGIKWERNTLDKKLFASKGTRSLFQARYLQGKESTFPGSTNAIEEPVEVDHNWVVGKFSMEKYWSINERFSLGSQLDLTISTQPFFNNYTASLLASPFFQPIPESKTLFQNEFRAHQFSSVGGKVIYMPRENIEVRTEHYLFQPYQSIERGVNDKAEYGDTFENRYYIGTIGAIYHSPLGPLSFNVNYYDQRDEPWTWIINFGYLIFNKRALE